MCIINKYFNRNLYSTVTFSSDWRFSSVLIAWRLPFSRSSPSFSSLERFPNLSTPTLWMISSIFSKASSMFLLCVRCFVLFTTRQSSLLILFFSNIRRRAATHLGRNPDATAPLRDKAPCPLSCLLCLRFARRRLPSARRISLHRLSPTVEAMSYLRLLQVSVSRLPLEIPIDDDDDDEEETREPPGEEVGKVKLLPRFGGLFLLFLVPGVGFFRAYNYATSSSSKSSELSFHGSSKSSSSSSS